MQIDHNPSTVILPVVLQAQDIRKSYGPRVALHGLSFNLNAGRVMGFLGPNGAGKTTTIRILTTILEPSSGQFTIDGTSSEYPEEIRRKIGVLPENLGFPRHITGSEYLIYFAQLYGRSAADAKIISKALIEEVGMEARARSLIGTYSHGMRQRIGIARALVNDPVVLFLDEPTLGLDPRGQQELLAMIRRIARERSVGIILCSHALPEIESTCDDVIILMGGRVVTNGPVRDVISQTVQNVVRVRIPEPYIEQALPLLESLPDIAKVAPVSEVSGWLRVELTTSGGNGGEYANNRLLDNLIHASIPITGFEAEGGKLQDVFLQLTEGNIK